jgi:type IV secretion system protein VirB9
VTAPAYRTFLATALISIGSAALSSPARHRDPAPGAVDPRIRTVAYDPDQVVRLTGYFGIQTMLEFAPDERIENVSIGDAMGWQVTPNKKANLLFLKPLDRTAATNMTVVTDRRRYVFELVVARPRPRPRTWPMSCASWSLRPRHR